MALIKTLTSIAIATLFSASSLAASQVYDPNSEDTGPLPEEDPYYETVMDLTFLEFVCFAFNAGGEPGYVDRVCGTNLTGDYPENSNNPPPQE